MKFDEVKLILKHPELMGFNKKRYAYRLKWLMDAHKEWDEAFDACTEPTKISVDCPYVEYNASLGYIFFGTGKRDSYMIADNLPIEDLIADDWCYQKKVPNICGMGGRQYATLDFMLTLKSLTPKDRQLIQELKEELAKIRGEV